MARDTPRHKLRRARRVIFTPRQWKRCSWPLLLINELGDRRTRARLVSPSRHNNIAGPGWKTAPTRFRSPMPTSYQTEDSQSCSEDMLNMQMHLPCLQPKTRAMSEHVHRSSDDRIRTSANEVAFSGHLVGQRSPEAGRLEGFVSVFGSQTASVATSSPAYSTEAPKDDSSRLDRRITRYHAFCHPATAGKYWRWPNFEHQSCS